MAVLFDTCNAALPHSADDPRTGRAYFLALGFPADFWESEAQRVIDTGDCSSRMHAPKASRLNIDGRFAQVPWSYVCLLFALRPVARHFIEAGRGDSIVFAFYWGMSDAIEAALRIIAHGTSAGNPGMWELWFRKTPTTAHVPAGMPVPVILARTLAFTAVPVAGVGRYTPAAALESVVGACTLAVQPLTLSFGTSPHGDCGLLFQEHVRTGRPPVPPLAHTFLRESAASVNLLRVPVSSEPNVLMRAHLRIVENVVAKLPPIERGMLLPDGSLSLAAAWSWLVGDEIVSRATRALRPPVPRVLTCPTSADDVTMAILAEASLSADTVSAAEEAGTGEPFLPSALPVVLLEVTRPLKPAVSAFLLRSHLTIRTIRELLGRHMAGSVVNAALQVMGIPRRVTPGAPHITEDDIRNAFDAEARRQRGGTTVDEHILNVLLGELADFGWAHTEVTVDPQVRQHSFVAYEPLYAIQLYPDLCRDTRKRCGLSSAHHFSA